MKCPNCGKEVANGFLCPFCHVDMYIFRKAGNASIRLYNEGLRAAKEQDLSHAVDVLQQSLLFDKNNIDAHNLLGLIYAEIGHIAEAMKHWIISTSLLKTENPASRYIQYWQKHARELERQNDAIRMYNQSLRYLQQGSDDLAIIQLKKCIDVNPNLIDAYNLMTLCCLKERNYKRAYNLIDFVLKKDCKNTLALKYLQVLSNEKKLPSQKSKKFRFHSVPQDVNDELKMTDSTPPIPRYKRSDKKGIHVLEKRDLIAFFIGVAASAMVLLLLVQPAWNEEQNKTIQSLQAQVESYAGTTNMTPEEVVEMRQQMEVLETDNKKLRSEETKQANIALLETAISQLSDEKYEECATTLQSIETVGFSDEELQKYESTKAAALPKAAEAIFTKGKSAFLSNNYIEARTYLENVLKMVDSGDFVDDVYFYLGEIAKQEENTEKAKEYYQMVISKYPDSNQLENAKLALESLNNAAESEQANG